MVTRVEGVRARVSCNDCWNVILIGFVVIKLCLTCFTFNSAVSLVVTDIFYCDKNFISNNTTNFLPVTTGFLVYIYLLPFY